MRFLKNLVSLLFILIFSTAIFFIVSQDRQVKQDILTTSLKMFGDDLLALVPEGEQRDVLSARFNEFIAKAEDDQVSPEQIEHVAATILNLSNSEKVYSSDQVLSVLAISDSSASDTIIFRTAEIMTPHARPVYRKRPPMTEKEKKALAERLTELEQFQSRIKKISQTDSSWKNFRENVYFTSDSVIKVAIKAGYLDASALERRPDIQKRIAEMEEQELVYWVDKEQDTLTANIRLHRDIARMAHQMAANISIEMPDSLVKNMEALETQMDSLTIKYEMKAKAEKP